MSFSLDLSQNTRPLSLLKTLDVIEYQSEFIKLDRFVVLTVDRDDSIPAILIQLWKFDGGYNHAVSNVMQNDLGMNMQVPFFEPVKTAGILEEITAYRPKESGLSRKEEFYFDLEPQSTSTLMNSEYPIPYKAVVTTDTSTKELVIPEWTPAQRLPLGKIQEGTKLELWTVGDITTIMRVLQI